jgi:hypothetical protein
MYDAHSRVDLDEVRYQYRAFSRFVHDGGITPLDGGSVQPRGGTNEREGISNSERELLLSVYYIYSAFPSVFS